MEAEAAARALVGTPFRLHGRDPATGLDCVGLVAAVHGASGVPRGYSIRTADARVLGDGLRAAGLEPVVVPRTGDVLIMRPGPAQLHLGIATAEGTIHAHAGLGRVVETPGAPPWPVIARYRKED